MKTFKEFMDNAYVAYSRSLEESKKSRKKKLEKRMSDAYQKTARLKKLRKLEDDPDHWRGLS